MIIAAARRRDWVPAMGEVFEGDKAETETMLRTIEAFNSPTSRWWWLTRG
jgi:hypothetical protein